MSGSIQCPHSDLHFDINHQGFNDSNIHYMEIKARCKICDKPMVFQGKMPFGLSPAFPTRSLGGEEITIPFLGEGEELVGKVIGLVGKVVV